MNEVIVLGVGKERELGDDALMAQNVQAILDAARDLKERIGKERALNAPRAVELGKEALRLLQTIPDEAVSAEQILLEARVYFALGNAQERLSDYNGAFESGEEALGRANLLREAVVVARSERPLRSVSRAGYALTLQKDVINDFRSHADSISMDAYALLGNVCDRRGDYAAALNYRRADHDLALLAGNAHQQAHALLRLGGSYFRLGNFPAALNLYLKARTAFEALNDYAGLGSTWNDIGNVRFGENHYDAALEAYQNGLAQFQHTADPYWQAGLLSNIAGVCLKQDKPAEARTCLEQSLHLRESVGDRHGQGYSLSSLVEVLRGEGNLDRARICGARALSLFDQIGDQAGTCFARLHLAAVETEAKCWDKAEHYLNDSLLYAEAQGVREVTYQVHAEFSRLFEAKGDTARALAHYKQFHAVKEAMLDETSRDRLRNLEALHGVEQARREAELLRQHNDELSAANALQAELLTQLQQQATVLENLSRTDALTGLLNRRSLEEALRAAHDAARKNRQPLSVAVMDLDYFKQINDCFSHQMGDDVLQIVARLLTRDCGNGCFAARYGGEEFVLVLPGMQLDAATAYCEALRQSVAEHPWHSLHTDLGVTASIGLCANDPGLNPEQMLSRADARLYEAKAAGRNRVFA